MSLSVLDGGDARSGSGAWSMLFTAWLVALLSSLAVLFVGEIVGQTPCSLCWFQRACMFPLAVMLAVAALKSDTGVWRYAAPVAASGWGVAGFHTLVFVDVIPEGIRPCGRGPSCAGVDMTVLGGVPLPALSLLAFSAILSLLYLARRRTSA